MAAILLGIAALVIGTLLWSQNQISELKSSIEVSEAYNETALAAALSSIYSTQYQASGNPDDLLSYQQALQDTFRFAAKIEVIGTDEDRQFLAALQEQHADDIIVALGTIEAISAGAFEPAAYEGPGVLTEITEALTTQAQLKRDSSIADLASIQSRLDELFLGAIAALVIGIPVIFGSYWITRRYEHKETVRELEMERLAQAALTDSLTGLPNHRAFQEELRREVARAARYERPITIAMMDVDDFKEVNDSEGHAKGDAVLAELAGLLTYVRGQDRAYRVGGDEFALIMPETDGDEAAAALDRLRVSTETGLGGTSISIGYASTRDLYTAEALRDHADMALYEAKHRGKNQVAAYNPGLAHGVEVTTAKTQAIRRTLERGSVTMWYQPIYHNGSKQLLAFEALLRLPEEPGIDGPQEAFQIAQLLGNTRDLDLLCVAEALKSAADLPSHVKLFINLDPATLTNSRFSVDDLLKLVEASPFEPAQIVFEVTEQTVAPIKALQEQVEAIRAAGFGAALDDVGTGNSGLELMRMIKFDYVKIDRSVIVDASDGGQGRAVILAIVAFARETGSFMIAEGIEDAALLKSIQWDEDGLREFWVRGMQGFLLGEPRASMSSFLGTESLDEMAEPAA